MKATPSTPTQRRLFVIDKGNLRYARFNEEKEAQATAEALERIEQDMARLCKEAFALRTGCTHKVFFDTPSFPYDLRTCAACGRTELV